MHGLGGVLSPLLTRLFLALRLRPIAINTTGQNELGNLSVEWNNTATPYDIGVYSNNFKILLSFSGSFEESDVVYGEQPFILLVLLLAYIILGVMFITCCTDESKAQSFLSPFVMLQMSWTKFDGAYLLSLLWGFFTAGRFTGVVIARFLSPRKLACLCLCLLIVSYIVLAVGGLLEINVIIWTILPCVGLGLSFVFPTFVVWTHEHDIEVIGKMSGYFYFVTTIGFFTDPFYMFL
ncbi:hypothetical protein MAR_015393 [Mya arenaria]|uniref:Uncharacterized protein n=1 Tax=Mya arenaria TaxID=6604 RepID=A0ABY7FJB9_MYAAR|nr:hypothetical protein MAR_015393 [Mya arenaria]